MNEQHGKAAGLCNRDMHHGHAYTLLQTLAFLHAEWIRAEREKRLMFLDCEGVRVCACV
jgi:hypothetical protein